MTGPEFDRALSLIERQYPRSTLLYARIILALSAARNREMAQADLSDQLGKGRDNTGIQQAVAILAELAIVTREMAPADAACGRFWLVRLSDPKGWPIA